jgi:hypothetical protein
MITLDSSWKEKLAQIPETEMGYQVADIYLKNGYILPAVKIFNAQYCIIEQNYTSDNIEKILPHSANNMDTKKTTKYKEMKATQSFELGPSEMYLEYTVNWSNNPVDEIWTNSKLKIYGDNTISIDFYPGCINPTTLRELADKMETFKNKVKANPESFELYNQKIIC